MEIRIRLGNSDEGEPEPDLHSEIKAPFYSQALVSAYYMGIPMRESLDSQIITDTTEDFFPRAYIKAYFSLTSSPYFPP